MSKYLYNKFFGKYRILVPIDKNTNDFPRSVDGDIETEDFYIPCKYGEISHYGRNILQAYVFSGGKYKSLEKRMTEEGIVPVKVQEGQNEATIFFNVKDIEFFASELKAKTMGKNIRPFSSKNLPKSNYVIPEEDLAKYKEAIANISKDDLVKIHRIQEEFCKKVLSKKLKIKDIFKDMKKEKMYRQKKEYIHSKGYWDEFITYLSKSLQTSLKE